MDVENIEESGEQYQAYGPRPAGVHPVRNGMVDVTRVQPGYERLHADFFNNLDAPFVGLTSDGVARTERFTLSPTRIDMSRAAERASHYLSLLTEGERERGHLAPDAREWRAWLNAFPSRPPHGVLLEHADTAKRDGAMSVWEELLSEDGYRQMRTGMRINRELGQIAPGYEDSLREWMYWFTVFGDPGGEAWGVQLFGHHVCINAMVVGDQLNLSPIFLGAEPRAVITSDATSLRLFDDERELGVQLMASLDERQAAAATLAPGMSRDQLPPRLSHPTEGRLQGAAARDNAIVPFEGVNASDMSPRQQAELLTLIGVYIHRMRADQAELKMAEIAAALPETYFAWVGNPDLAEPFYYRIHSPVIFIELDAHHGIFLANDEPQPFHIHTIVRVPNGNDYGRAWLDASRATTP